jgi:hypothetical protein
MCGRGLVSSTFTSSSADEILQRGRELRATGGAEATKNVTRTFHCSSKLVAGAGRNRQRRLGRFGDGRTVGHQVLKVCAADADAASHPCRRSG